MADSETILTPPDTIQELGARAVRLQDDPIGDHASPGASGRPEPAPHFPQLNGEMRADVVIIGAGITGITAATLLKQAGKSVVVVEARRVGAGESSRTTAHLSAYSDTRFRTLTRNFGEKNAHHVWTSGSAALAQIESLISAHSISCHFKRANAYLYTERSEGISDLQDEYAACAHIDVPATFVREGPGLPPRAIAALRFENQAHFNLLEYLLPLARALPGQNCHVFEESPVVQIEEGDDPYVVTSSGTIRAKDIVVAAHVPINNRLLLQTKIAAYRSYVLRLNVSGPIPADSTWDDLDPYHYVRPQILDGIPYLLVGGEDHRTGRIDDGVDPFANLEAWTRERYAVESVQARWSGQIIMPVDGLPYIGQNSFARHVWEATGYGGNGMTFGTLAGMILCDLIVGRENPWSELYDATRVKPLAAAKDYVKENIAFPKLFIGDRMKARPHDPVALAPGEGGIFELQGQKCAVYRDLEGDLHSLSSVCPHLGCHVAFNSIETSWDCPCHGSRFDTDGKVLNGPAARGLERVDIPLTPAVDSAATEAAPAMPHGGAIEPAM